MDVACGMEGVGRTAAGAVKPGPAGLAVRTGVDIAALERITNLRMGHAVPHIPQLVLRIGDKLVTGIEIAPGGDGHVLRAGATAGNALVDAGALGKVDHIVIEGNGLALLLPANHILGQQLILLEENRQILLGQLAGISRLGHHRLHGELGEAEVIRHVEDVLGEVRIVMREGTAHVVVLIAPLLHKVLEVGHNPVIAAAAGSVYTEAVVDLLPAVQAQHHIVALLIGPLDDLVINVHAVGGQGEAEILVVLLLHRTGIGHQLLADLEIHKGLAAEEVHLQIPAGAGILDQEIQGALTGFKAHEAGIAVELSLRGEAVFTVQVAGMGHQKTKGLHHSIPVFECAGNVLVNVLCKKLSAVDELLNVGEGILNGLRGSLRVQLGQLLFCRLPVESGVQQVDAVIGQLVRHMDTGAEYVNDDIVAIHLVLMNHVVNPLWS